MAGELTRITPRDRHLLELLDQHKTFTTEQLVDLAFGSVGRARNRLNTLHERDILDRFRHYQRPGSQSWRWTLGPVGAALIAAARGNPLPRPSAVRDATARLAMSPTLTHLLTVNGFFTSLTRHTRADPGTRLARWWNEARCRDAVGAIVRPDGHGILTTGGYTVPFWLEADLGTETLTRVTGKLAGYAALPPARAYPVLFWLPTTARETHLHAHLTRNGLPDALIVATAVADTGDLAGPVWWVAGYDGGRVRLANLASVGGGARWRG
ncbi:replication-relaxation family protein [Paractinoplanes globisporus]|uniref:Replication-relaxation family protein n=1 Tax=Paractinoplanes globisporus TaxID=113565 RepID=A0ABW6WIA1_9ACTN|nr:replication-relaxation family protein [Actinoplanes globisporus]